MSFRPDHEIHGRRFGRNLGIGLTLAAFVVLVFGLTVVKVTRASDMIAAEKAAATQGIAGKATP